MASHRKILAVAPLLLWFALLLPAHQHAAHAAGTSEHATATHHAPDDHDAPADDHGKHPCAVCYVAAHLAATRPPPVAIAPADRGDRAIVLTAQRHELTRLPQPFDGRAPPLA